MVKNKVKQNTTGNHYPQPESPNNCIEVFHYLIAINAAYCALSFAYRSSEYR